MLISNLEATPTASERIRLSAKVTYRSRSAGSEVVWFEFSDELLDRTSRSGNPWLLALLPLAFVTHEPLQIELPIDPILLENLGRLMTIWSDWYPEFSPVPIEASDVESIRADPSRSAVFFSGGVDSYYTVLHHRSLGDVPIDDLVFVHGADIPVDEQEGFARATASIARAGKAWNMPLVTVATNLRSTRFRLSDWGQLSHGAFFGAVGLLFDRCYRRIYLSSSWPQQILHPHGTHPDTDPLMSTALTSFVHYGVWADRIHKIAFISGDPLVLANLRVCWKNTDGTNCGQCTKCQRTMAALEVVGRLATSTAFPSNQLDIDQFRRDRIGADWTHYQFLGPFAHEQGRDDIADAFEAARRSASRRERWMLLGLDRKILLRIRRSPWVRQWLRSPYQWMRRLASSMKFRAHVETVDRRGG